jgi:protein with PEP-CTERM/exosortase system signal
MNKLPKLLLICIAIVSVRLCWADIIFQTGNNPQPDEQNVLLNKGTIGSIVQGTTNQTGDIVNFISAKQTLFEPANGQARIGATNGASQIGLTDINNISLAKGLFGDLIFNMHIGGTTGTSGGTATISVLDNHGNVSAFTMTLGNGENFLTIFTSNNQLIESVGISYARGFTDLRQVRISGIVEPVPDGGATLSLLGTSLVGLVFLRRKLGA